MSALERARQAYNLACEERDKAFEALNALEDTATEEEVAEISDAFDRAQAEVDRCHLHMEELQRRFEARENTPVIVLEDAGDGANVTITSNLGNNVNATGTSGTVVFAQPRGSRVEHVYRPNNDNGNCYFHDLYRATFKGDVHARERLAKSEAMSQASQYRDITTSATAGGGFVPPLYMGDLWAEAPRPGRPFANAVGSRPLPSTGMSITLPRVTTAPAVGAQTSENSALTETDLVEATLTTAVNTVGGFEDVAVQLLERSDPGIDMIVFEALRDHYDATLDTYMLSGSGASGQHRGIKNVSGTNAVTYSDFASPTAAELVPKLYDAIQKVASNRYLPADAIIMHPRRAAWLASNLSSTFPLFQQGSLTQASGTQNAGFVNGFAGLQVIHDANISTAYGTPTATEDTIYVVRLSDLILFEDGVRAEVFRETISDKLTVRLRLYGYSAFVSGRYPSAISEITGQGLVTPSF
jgi:HK97 family phage major capsid protein